MKTNLSLSVSILVVAFALGAEATPLSQEVQNDALMLYKRTFLSNQKCFNAPIPPWKPGCMPGWYYGKPCRGLQLPAYDGFDKAACSWLSYIPILNNFSSLFCQGKLITKPIPPSCTPPSVPPKTTSTTTTTKSSSTSSSSSTTSSSSSTLSSSSTSTSTTPVPTPTTTSVPTPVCTGTANTYQVVFTNYTTTATDGVYTGQVVGAATQDNSYITFGMVDNVDQCFTMCDSVQNCTFINTYHDVEDDEPTGQHDPSKLKCVLFGNCVDPKISNNNWGGQNDPNYITDSNGYCRSGNCPVSLSK